MAYPDNVARIDWRFTNAVNASVHVIQHAKINSGDYDYTACLDVAQHCKDSWDTVGYLGGAVAALKSNCNINTTLLDVTVTGLKTLAPPQAILAVNVAGSQAGNAMPPETAVVVSFKTGIPGKSFRGRSYWPGVDPDQLENNGTLSAAALTSYQNQWTAFINIMATNTTSTLVVHSPTLGLATTALTAVVRDTLHHQRRRNS